LIEFHPAAAQADQPVGIARCQLGLMQYAHDGQAVVGCQTAQQLHHFIGGLGVETSHRFVGEQHLRALRERACNGHALRLATRQRAGTLMRQVQQANFVKKAQRRFDFAFRNPAQCRSPRPVTTQRTAAHIRQHTTPFDQIGVLGNDRERQATDAQILAR